MCLELLVVFLYWIKKKKKQQLGISLHSNKLTFWLTYKSSATLSHEAWASLLGVWGVPLSITFCLLEHSLVWLPDDHSDIIRQYNSSQGARLVGFVLG